MNDHDTVASPSWGLVGISRRQYGGKGPRLFQSTVNSYSTICLTVKRASLRRDLHRDFVFGEKQLIEIEMSPAQFAELITTPNVGDGVPCTLRWLPGEGSIEHEEDPDRTEQFKSEFAEDLEEITANATALLAKAKRSRSIPKEILEQITKLEQDVRANIPFLRESFDKYVEKRVTHAKGEFDAYVTGAIHRAGLDAIKGGWVPALETGKEDNGDGG